jgi:peptide/nickel transport system ATP-binding protein
MRAPLFPPLLEIRDLQMEFTSPGGSLKVLDGLSLVLEKGNTLCLVGESGCGKSVTGLSLGRLIPSPPARYVGGQIVLEGEDVLRMTPRELRKIRGRVIGYVFQEPAVSLNPAITVGKQIMESLDLHQPQRANRAEVIRLLTWVGVPSPEIRMNDYPHQLSGGLQQRVMIAMAIAPEPQLLVADEPTTALDATVQAQILELLRELQRRLGMAMLLITHNLAIVSEMANLVAVMYAGQIVEHAPVKDLLTTPLHPYTRALIKSVPRLGAETRQLAAIPGRVPSPGEIPCGCRFQPRCPIARPSCAVESPELMPVMLQRGVRCPFWAERNP